MTESGEAPVFSKQEKGVVKGIGGVTRFAAEWSIPGFLNPDNSINQPHLKRAQRAALLQSAAIGLALRSEPLPSPFQEMPVVKAILARIEETPAADYVSSVIKETPVLQQVAAGTKAVVKEVSEMPRPVAAFGLYAAGKVKEVSAKFFGRRAVRKGEEPRVREEKDGPLERQTKLVRTLAITTAATAKIMLPSAYSSNENLGEVAKKVVSFAQVFENIGVASFVAGRGDIARIAYPAGRGIALLAEAADRNWPAIKDKVSKVKGAVGRGAGWVGTQGSRLVEGVKGRFQRRGNP